MSDLQRAVRVFDAPTRPEAEAMAAPVLAAFAAAGWTEEERLWIPGDRRVGLGESLLLAQEDQVLLEAAGTLRIAWTTTDPAATAPAVRAAARVPDEWEQLGGERYRRLVPRWIAGAVVLVIGLVVIIAVAGGGRRDTIATGFPGDPPSFSGYPAAADGSCPDGYGLEIDGDERVCWPDAYFEFTGASPAPQP